MVQTTTKLLIYQKVCMELGQRTIMSLTDTGPIASYTNIIYNDAVLFCLAQGMWHTWAVRFVSIPASTDIQPQFGWTQAFDVPADFVRIAEIADNDLMYPPLDLYDQVAGPGGNAFLANIGTLYLQYVSNDQNYGLNMAGWSSEFADYVATYIAWKICRQCGGSKQDADDLEMKVKRRHDDAASKDAADRPTGRLPPGNWTRARVGRRSFAFRQMV